MCRNIVDGIVIDVVGILGNVFVNRFTGGSAIGNLCRRSVGVIDVHLSLAEVGEATLVTVLACSTICASHIVIITGLELVVVFNMLVPSML
ncbi:hypothetical protein HG530_004174 [Fusarium avenaceum]|nr:hypothetical protein HG530_004174 [Fusarium avenaceum]